MTALILSLGLCLLAFTIVGALASRQAEASTADYLLAGRGVSPWLTALSSVATNNSGFMFIGLIGYAYSSGIEAIWFQISWILGDFLAWKFVHGRVRTLSERLDTLSVPAFLGTRGCATSSSATRIGRPSVERITVVAAGLLTFVFLAGYAAAQLKAGSTALEVLFGWHPALGASVGALIVVIYCFSGGIRASIWTDAAQSMVMIVSMAILAGYAVHEVGGVGALFDGLRVQDPSLVQLVPEFRWGIPLYVAGFVFGGFAAVGQPHVLIRTMALQSPTLIERTRRYYFGWFVPFSVLALVVGLYARAIIPGLAERLGPSGLALSAEHALPALSLELLPMVLVGVMLAGVFAATMSTADSQILACSAAVTQDLLPRYRASTKLAKAVTLTVTGLALALALVAKQGVFELVLMAWGILGSTLGPLVVLRVAGRVPAGWLALLMMFSGAATVTLWRPLSDALYEVFPGMAVPFLLYAVVGFFWPGAAGREKAGQRAEGDSTPER